MENKPQFYIKIDGCNSCEWKPQPGQIIPCDDPALGPWYCPKCKEKASILLIPLQEAIEQAQKKEYETKIKGKFIHITKQFS